MGACLGRGPDHPRPVPWVQGGTAASTPHVSTRRHPPRDACGSVLELIVPHTVTSQEHGYQV
jgi:hypothetical protein